VAVIVRPLLPLEMERGCTATVSVAGHNTVGAVRVSLDSAAAEHN
jgi:hypothetical protein